MKRRVCAALGAAFLALGLANLAVGSANASDDDQTLDPAPVSLAFVEAVESLEPMAKKLWPDTFGGLWLGPDGLGDTITIAFTDDADANVAQLAKDFAEPELLRAVTVARSEADLLATQAELINDRDRVHAGAESQFGFTDANFDLGIDAKRNVVRVIRPSAKTGPNAALPEGVVVETGKIAAPQTCVRTDCKPELRSGLQTETSGGSYCTTAFTMIKPDGSRRVLSAAHCGHPDNCGVSDAGAGRWNGGDKYGEVAQNYCYKRVDAELHSINDPFIARPWLYLDGNNKEQHIRSESTYDGLPLYVDVCKSGVRTARTCGQVLDKHYSPSYVPSGLDFIMADYCSLPGDSGAGVYHRDTPGRADGVHSGGTGGVDGYESCNEWTSADFTLFGHIEPIMNVYGVSVAYGS